MAEVILATEPLRWNPSRSGLGGRYEVSYRADFDVKYFRFTVHTADGREIFTEQNKPGYHNNYVWVPATRDWNWNGITSAGYSYSDAPTGDLLVTIRAGLRRGVEVAKPVVLDSGNIEPPDSQGRYGPKITFEIKRPTSFIGFKIYRRDTDVLVAQDYWFKTGTKKFVIDGVTTEHKGILEPYEPGTYEWQWNGLNWQGNLEPRTGFRAYHYVILIDNPYLEIADTPSWPECGHWMRGGLIEADTPIFYELKHPVRGVRLEVYTQTNKPVKTVSLAPRNKLLAPGYYQFVWDGRNELGERVAKQKFHIRLIALKAPGWSCDLTKDGKRVLEGVAPFGAEPEACLTAECMVAPPDDDADEATFKIPWGLIAAGAGVVLMVKGG